MTQKLSVLLVTLLLLGAAVPASAANKEHQQLMADLRMLQEQSQQLQNLIGSVTEALRGVNAKMDQQAEANRKAFLDGYLTRAGDSGQALGEGSRQVRAFFRASPTCIAGLRWTARPGPPGLPRCRCARPERGAGWTWGSAAAAEPAPPGERGGLARHQYSSAISAQARPF
jgi:hypothetical protein